MKTTVTPSDHINRINRVLNHIQNNLDQPMLLEKLAGIACFSPFHFHRIFSACLGESLNNYIRRLRLERSAMKLCYTDIPITDLAFNAGYETPSSFTKSFKQLFGITPSAFRREKTITVHPQSTKIELHNKNGGYPMRHTIQQRVETQVIYVRRLGDYKQAACEAWNALCKHAFQRQLVSDGAEFIGISYDDPTITEAARLRYDACITVKGPVKAEGNIGVQKVAGGDYAVFHVTGSYNKLHAAYGIIFGEWLQQTKYTLRDVPCFEKYLNDPETTPEDELQTEIFIPVE